MGNPTLVRRGVMRGEMSGGTAYVGDTANVGGSERALLVLILLVLVILVLFSSFFIHRSFHHCYSSGLPHLRTGNGYRGSVLQPSGRFGLSGALGS